MEKNNGRPEQPEVKVEMTKEELIRENQELKTVCGQMHGRIKQLENGWALQRAQFLFEVLKTDGFSVESRQKAIDELEGFLFPVANKEDK